MPTFNLMKDVQQDHLRIKQLREELHAHNHRYYVPGVADHRGPGV